MATWSISPNSGATINSSGVFSASTNPMETSRSWTVTYTDNDNHTASTVITQEGCMACPTGVTVVPYQGYTIGTASGYDYKVTFDDNVLNQFGLCRFYVDAAYYDGEQGSVEDCAYAGINVTINDADECVYAKGGDDWIEEDDYSVSVDCYQYGAKNYDYWQGKRLSLDITNQETNVTKKVLVEMHNTPSRLGVEFIFSGEGWTTLMNSAANGYNAGVREYTHEQHGGVEYGVGLSSFPAYQLKIQGHLDCTSFSGNIASTFTADTSNGVIGLDTRYIRPMRSEERIDIRYPSNTDINNSEWQNMYIEYLPSLSATDSTAYININCPEKFEVYYGNYANPTIITTNTPTHPTTNIPNWSLPPRASIASWGQYGPAVGKGYIFAIMAEIPENPATEKLKVIYYLHTPDND